MASKRRGHGDGGVRKRPDGRWEGTVDVATYGTARRRKYVYGRTRAEVVERLRAVQHTKDEGLPVIDERVTLARFLQTWLDQVVNRSADMQRGRATKSTSAATLSRCWATAHLPSSHPPMCRRLSTRNAMRGWHRGPFSTCTPRYEPLLAWPSVGASSPATWPRWSTQYPLTGHRSSPSNPRRSRLS